jgi:hypothetical protein
MGAGTSLQLTPLVLGQLDGLDGEHGASPARFTTSNHKRPSHTDAQVHLVVTWIPSVLM